MNKGFHLSLRMGSLTNPTPAPQPVMDSLQSVQVTASASSQSGFQLKLSIGKKSPLMQLLTSGFFDPRTRVIISVTANGQTEVLIDGIITKQDYAPSNQPAASTLTITGLDISAVMDFIDLTGIPYPALPSAAVVLLILAKYAVFGIAPVVIPSIITIVEIPVMRIRRQVGTDYAYVNQLARTNGHVFYIDPGNTPGQCTAYWGPDRGRSGTPQPALTIDFDTASNVEALSFSYDGMQAEQLIVTILEPNTHIPIPIPVPDITLLKSPLSANTPTPLRSRILGEVTNKTPAEAALLALAALTTSSDAVTGSGSLDVVRYGHIFKPRQAAAVRGAGYSYDGLYYVNSVTHNIKRGEYKQSFSLKRGGTGSTLQAVSA